MNAEPTTEERIGGLERRASVTSDSIGGLRAQMIEILARMGRVESDVAEIRADVDKMSDSLVQIKEALAAVRSAGDARAQAAADQSARILDLLGRAIDGRTATEQAQIAARGAGLAEMVRQAAPIIGAVGGLAGAIAAAWAALR